MKYLILSFVLAASVVSFASEAGHDPHAGVVVPTKQILYQAINVFIIFVALFYFLKDGIRKFFQDKRATFLADASKAELARKNAEQDYAHIQKRLSQLESSADESRARARAEAADLKKQLIADAEALSSRIKKETEQAVSQEIERAKSHLRETLIKESIVAARAQFSARVSNEDQVRLQSNFVSNLQAVQK